MEGSVSNVDICNLAYTGQLEQVRQSVLSDKTLICKTDQVRIHALIRHIKTIVIYSQSFSFQDHRTALHWACSAGHTNIVEFLLDMGAEVNLQDDVGQRVRVLFVCVRKKNEKKKLLDSKPMASYVPLSLHESKNTHQTLCRSFKIAERFTSVRL